MMTCTTGLGAVTLNWAATATVALLEHVAENVATNAPAALNHVEFQL